MKKIPLFLLLVCVSFAAFAQKKESLTAPNLPIDEATKLITFEEVVPETGTPQELYDRAWAWVKAEYKNTSEIMKVNDRDKAFLMLRSSVRIYGKKADGTPHFRNIVYYILKIECRKDRYRYTITEFKEKATAEAPIEVWADRDHVKWQPAHFDYLNQVNDQVQTLITSLKKGMLPKVEEVDEW